MLAMKLVRLIERHSGELTQGLVQQIRLSQRTSDFRKIPATDLQLAASEVYRNLGEWLLQKTEGDIEARFKNVAARRAEAGIRLHQFVWALMLSRDQLFHFLRQEAFLDSIVELHGELELRQLLHHFFDRAVYYSVVGYEEAGEANPRSQLRRVRELAASVGLISDSSAST